jgi:Cd2+/Zn2+-exporting ATPase
VRSAVLAFPGGTLVVDHDPARVTTDRIIGAVDEAGYYAEVDLGQRRSTKEPAFWRKNRRAVTTAASAFLLACAYLLSFVGIPPVYSIALFLASIVVGGFYIARAGLASLRALSVDMNLLMIIAVVGGAAIGQWEEAATVLVLFSLGNTLEAYTVDRTRRSLHSLLDLFPKEALVRRADREITLPLERIEVGDIMVIKPGQRIAMDGEVLSGCSTVNEAPLTGESEPVEKAAGDKVYAGTVNDNGAMEMRVTRPFNDNTISRIIQLVEQAQAGKAPSQRLVDRFARLYTPAVIIVAAVVALLPPLLFAASWHDWLYRALVLLVISCPCALVISTPVSIAAAIGQASRNGVLIKGGAYLEEMARITVVAFDKTGTLTKGRPEVVEVIPLAEYSSEAILAIAAALESRSEHHLGRAIVRKAHHTELQPMEASGFRALPGKGVSGFVNGESYLLGNASLVEA